MNWVIFGSSNGFSPVRCQAKYWTITDILPIEALGSILCAICIEMINLHSGKRIQNVCKQKVISLWPNVSDNFNNCLSWCSCPRMEFEYSPMYIHPVNQLESINTQVENVFRDELWNTHTCAFAHYNAPCRSVGFLKQWSPCDKI